MTLSTEDRTAIVETCSAMTYLIDERRWERLTEVLAPTVTIDYTDLFGGKVATTTREGYIANAAALLGGLDSTHHHVGGHLVSGDSASAECISQVIATHVKATRTGGPLWTVGAQYEMTLGRHDGGAWRIEAVRAVQRWCSGNREVMRLGKSAG